MKKIIKYITLITLIAFTLLTLFLSSSVIFDWFGIRAKEGNYVLFVVWANLISSFLYLCSIYGVINLKKWSIKPLIASIIILILALIGLFIHINLGGLYETRTVGALFFRITVTLIFTILTYLITIKWHK
ncbi:hypothetical protein [Lutibacter sp.]|uniref:hypothetical protein n=1 Tax=Lutibacter sp. TaxID=1925666 RepID=UPI0025BA5D92|nr:hypothetical protein [Lutibacter sp.]MCF6182523.1 hypothetical protein [Lutibacter sp.]